jgi:dipeptidase D
MNLFHELTPPLIWKYFGEILEIPRPSKNEGKILNYLIEFAQKEKLEYKQDKAGNIVIGKKASEGMGNKPVIVLQSHVDMVCEKNSSVHHNFLTDAIKAKIEDGWVKAAGTTLGADNGIGVAAQLAVLSDKSLKHGPIECLFTVDEETGLTGAKEISNDLITGKILLNLDSEDEGEIFIGCAGGIDTSVSLDYKTVKSNKRHKSFRISLNGLKGGHSGDDINKGLANSNKLLVRFLWNCVTKFDIMLADFQGGNLRNAIPREAEALIMVRNKFADKFKEYFSGFLQTIKSEYAVTEPDLRMDIVETNLPKEVLTRKHRNTLLNALYACPNGVISMSQSVTGLVETSTNLASVHFVKKNTIEIVTSQRSSIESAKRDIADSIASTFRLAGANVKHGDGYPGWTPNTNSAILKVALKEYEKLFKTKPKVKAIHAGLECGLFLEKYPELDMISFGPTLRGVHSPDERMEIATVEKFWNFLIALLANIPEKQKKQ